MPTYKAKQLGYHDDVLRIEGAVFTSEVKYKKLPSWLELVDDNGQVIKQEVPKEDRKARITTAIRQMLNEDPHKERTDFWIGNGAPEVKELQGRTQLDDITAQERNAIWKGLDTTPSGGGKPLTPPPPTTPPA